MTRIGIDIGSTASKVCVIGEDEQRSKQKMIGK